jgi:hypothetical protein
MEEREDEHQLYSVELNEEEGEPLEKDREKYKYPCLPTIT